MKIEDINSWRKYANFKYIDRTYWTVYALLAMVAVIELFSASSSLITQKGSILGPVLTQTLYLIFGAAMAFCIQFTPSRKIRNVGYLIYGLSDVLLWLMLIPGFPGTVNRNGAARWFQLGPLPAFQPSELLKLGLVLVLADLFCRVRSEQDKVRCFKITLGLTAAAVLPVMIHNMSTAILICLVVLMMWYIARMPARYVWSTVAIASVAGMMLFGVLYFAYHSGKALPGHMASTVTRVETMFSGDGEDEMDIHRSKSSYQRAIAKVAIARGGISPVGVLPGNSQERDYLPVAYADYIFAIIVEEIGIIGAIFLCLLYLIVLYRACYTSSRYADYGAMYMVMGLALMLVCQAMISMMVTVGIGPVTGLPLPLISHGGTSVIITSIFFGIMMAVSREQLQNKTESTAAAAVDENLV